MQDDVPGGGRVSEAQLDRLAVRHKHNLVILLLLFPEPGRKAPADAAGGNIGAGGFSGKNRQSDENLEIFVVSRKTLFFLSGKLDLPEEDISEKKALEKEKKVVKTPKKSSYFGYKNEAAAKKARNIVIDNKQRYVCCMVRLNFPYLFPTYYIGFFFSSKSLESNPSPAKAGGRKLPGSDNKPYKHISAVTMFE